MLSTTYAGNEGHGDPDECTVAEPADAAWAVAVGGTLNGCIPPPGDNCPAADWTCVQTGPIYSSSSRGGAPYLFGQRSIIDTVAPAWRDLVADTDGGYVCVGGNSFAAPTIAAGAAVLRDWWIAQLSPPYIYNDPARIQAVLLLMGDRNTEQGGPATEGFDELWGNGRFRMRKFDDPGMDQPWAWGSGLAWVYDGQTATVPLNYGNPADWAVDQLKAVMWWAEPNLENNGEDGADIVFTVKNDTSCWSPVPVRVGPVVGHAQDGLPGQRRRRPLLEPRVPSLQRTSEPLAEQPAGPAGVLRLVLGGSGP